MRDEQEVKKLFIQRAEIKGVLNDEVIANFDLYYDQWLQSLPKAVKHVVLEMLLQFDYYSHPKINKGFKALFDILENEYGVNENNSVYTYLEKTDGSYASGVEYFPEFKMVNRINKHSCTDNIERFVKSLTDEEWSCVENIVIVDDCCGTGKSIRNYLEGKETIFDNKTVYYLVLHIMEKARADIEENKELKYHISNLHVVSLNSTKKAFELENIKNIQDARESIRQFSDSIGIPKKYWQGFNKSQSLLAFNRNTPNNTIGLFWYDVIDKGYKSIFPRKENSLPTWRMSKMKKEKSLRKEINYRNMVRDEKLY